ncbi:MAG: hypothetical protein IJQ02_04680, partial [Oscillospiraceae bacterium]|nr:hypothetical protein [Oscillospiraceae bacterium]
SDMSIPEFRTASVRAELFLTPAGALHHRLSAKLAGLFARLVCDDQLRHVYGQAIPAAKALHRISRKAECISNIS